MPSDPRSPAAGHPPAAGQPPAPEQPFAEPWQAQAFALAVHLNARGLFTWTAWTETFGSVLAMARTAGKPVDGDAYWRHWVTALEMMLTAAGTTDKQTLDALKDAWAQAYRDTPHGQPVRLPEARG